MQPITGIRRRDGTKVASEDQQQQADDDQVDPEGEKEGEQERRADDSIDDASLQGIADDEQGERIDRKAQKGVDVPAREQVPGDVRPQDHERAMRQVHDVEDAPHQAEAESDRDVDPTQQEAKDDLLGELAHELSSPVRTSVLT